MLHEPAPLCPALGKCSTPRCFLRPRAFVSRVGVSFTLRGDKNRRSTRNTFAKFSCPSIWSSSCPRQQEMQVPSGRSTCAPREHAPLQLQLQPETAHVQMRSQTSRISGRLQEIRVLPHGETDREAGGGGAGHGGGGAGVAAILVVLRSSLAGGELQPSLR